MLALITIPGLVTIILTLVVLGIIASLLHYLISKSPINEQYKGWIQFTLLALVIVVVIGMLLQVTGIYDFRGMR